MRVNFWINSQEVTGNGNRNKFSLSHYDNDGLTAFIDKGLNYFITEIKVLGLVNRRSKMLTVTTKFEN